MSAKIHILTDNRLLLPTVTDHNMKSRRHTFFLPIKILILILLSFTSEARQSPAILFVAKQRVIAEVADTPARQEKGLMNRKKLLPNHGMLFVFKNDAVHYFWMKDTLIPLDVAFIDDGGTIFLIKSMKPGDLTPVSSLKPCRYALEVQSGFFKNHRIKPGEKVGLKTEVSKYVPLRGTHFDGL